MPLQNRVLPDGSVIATAERGGLMGNRGGRIHDPATKSLFPRRRWASKRWISCILDFKGRHRTVWGNSYTELFFFDECVALAAGHRPCFECRRKDALAFQASFAKAGLDARNADAMDRILHAERTGPPQSAVSVDVFLAFPIGTMGCLPGGAFVRRGRGGIETWAWQGYRPVPHDHRATIVPLTPPSIRATLGSGYGDRLFHV